MTADELSGLLKFKGISQTKIAIELDISISQVNNVIRGFSKSDKVRKKLEEKLGRKIEIFEWPQYTRCNNTILSNKNKNVK